MRPARLALVVALVAAAPAGSTVRAQPPGGGAAPPARWLGGHRFVPSSFVAWPFIDTTFTSTSSFGIVDFEFDPGGPAALLLLDDSRDNEFLALAQVFSAGLALTPWLGVTLRLSGRGVVPRDRLSTVLVGAHALIGGEIGASIGILRLGRLQVTARADLGWFENRSIVPARLPASPYAEGNIGSLQPALVVALALAPWIGVQASGGATWRELDVEAEDRTRTLAAAVAITLNLDPTPIALLVGGELSEEEDRDLETATAHAFFGDGQARRRGELGLYYTGRRELDLGAVLTYERDDAKIDRRLFVQARMGFYF